MENMENTNSKTTLKEVVAKAKEIIAKHLNERDFENLEFKNSDVNGYVSVTFTIDGFNFRASFNKKGYICWHDYQGIKEPELTDAETKSICDYMWEKWDAERKATLIKEIDELQKELKELEA